MKATIRLERPEDVEVTITLTMPLREWKLVRADLRKVAVVSIPGHRLSQTIAELVSRTTSELLGVEQPEPEEVAPPLDRAVEPPGMVAEEAATPPVPQQRAAVRRRPGVAA